tara:strand:+ start:2284 stop:2805 length:522 start_codon:yes stop_codon:yes gene_type:complete
MSSILKVDTIQNTGGTTGLTIDSSGRVFQPAKPAWRIGRGSDLAVTSGQGATTNLDFDLTSDTATRCFVQGCTVNSGAITVPTSGLYHVGTSVRLDNIGGGYAVVHIRMNNDSSSLFGTYNIRGEPDSNYFTLADSTVFKLNANDVIRVSYYASSDSSFTVDQRSYFWGYLVG